MIKPQLRSHFDFTALNKIFVREAFARKESSNWRVFAGVQDDGWQVDEIFFSERKGAYAGLNIDPPRVVAADLMLDTATLEQEAITARGNYNFDPVLRVAAGTKLVAQSSVNYSDELGPTRDYLIRKATEWRLYSAATGDLVSQADSSGVLGVVANGSYVLWARCYKSNLGLVQMGGFGEWSAIKVVVGAGAFNWINTCYPGPGSPLYSKTGTAEIAVTEANRNAHDFPFDPLARIVSASCVTHTKITLQDGQSDIEAGSLLIAGVRASRGGPQTAVWLLGLNHNARLICADTTFSGGLCECAKTNHFASDIAQGTDGQLYIISECDCNVYEPDRIDVFQRMRPFPAETYGHPGGHALRPVQGAITFFSEGVAVAPLDGKAWYNGLIYRAGTHNYGSVSSRWHGVNCAELFRGKLFAVRQDTDDLDSRQTVDSITSGRWDRKSIVAQPASNRTWQRLRRCNESLYVFGYETIDSTDLSTLNVVRESSFEPAAFPYFIRRATPSARPAEAARLLLAARAQADSIGIANRVIEIESAVTRICGFWNQAQGRFRFDYSDFVGLGGDVTKLPPYLKWKKQLGANGGGVWLAATTQPTETPPDGYNLTLSTAGDNIYYSGTLPYDYRFWGVLCFEIQDDGSVTGPSIETDCHDAKCVFDLLPTGTKWRHQRLEVPSVLDPLWSLQVSDVNEDDRLQLKRDELPLLWLRMDSTADFDDLSSYKKLTAYGREIFLSEPVSGHVDLMMIYPAGLLPCQSPVMVRRA